MHDDPEAVVASMFVIIKSKRSTTYYAIIIVYSVLSTCHNNNKKIHTKEKGSRTRRKNVVATYLLWQLVTFRRPDEAHGLSTEVIITKNCLETALTSSLCRKPNVVSCSCLYDQQ